MARLYAKPSYAHIVRLERTRFAGEVAEREGYVCRQCNARAAVALGSPLPLCPACYGRRFTLL